MFNFKCKSLCLLLFVSLNNVAFPKADIVNISGDGQYRPAEKNLWIEAFIQQHLEEKSTVKTLPFSTMALLFSDHTQIKLHENSILTIKETKNPNETVLDLIFGRIWSRKTLPENLTIETPSANASIRGTDWEMEVDANGHTTVTVITGSVKLSNDFGQIVINQNEQGIAIRGQPPTKKILVAAKDRVQWVSDYQIEPISRLRPLINSKNDSAHAVLNLLQEGKFGQAQQVLQQLPDHNSAKKPLQVTLLILNNEFITAEKLLLKELLNNSSQVTTTSLLADLLSFKGDLEQALKVLNKNLEVNPNNTDLLVQAANIALILDRQTMAKAYIDKANQSHPKVRLVRARIAWLNGNWNEAQSELEKVLSSQQYSAIANYDLGKYYTELENIPKARKFLTTALELVPNQAEFWGQLGILESFANNIGDAQQAFDQALALSPTDYVSLTGVGILQLKHGQPEKALDNFLKSTLLEPNYARAHTYAAIAYYQLGKVTQAIRELNDSHRIDPKDPLPFYFLSIIWSEQFLPSRALTASQLAVERLPYLKSLNQLASDQKGSANVGQAIAFFGLQDWALNMANQSYYPFWSGSHFFLADRYDSLFNKNSALYQGFLSNPTAIGAQGRFQSIIARPDINARVSSSYATAENHVNIANHAGFNGYNNRNRPVAFNLNYFNFNTKAENYGDDNASLDSEGSSHSFIAAVGYEPTSETGLFLFQTFSHSSDDFDGQVTGTPISASDVTRTTTRTDIGGSYKLSPTSQIWVKAGIGSEDQAQPNIELGTDTLEIKADYSTSDLAVKHSFATPSGTLSLGYERANRDIEKAANALFDLGITILDQTDVENINEQSSDLYATGQWAVSSATKFQLDMHYIQFERQYKLKQTYVPDLFSSNLETLTNQSSNRLYPRIGVHTDIKGFDLKIAYQSWMKPAAITTLSSVSTVGLPIAAKLIDVGGKLNRTIVNISKQGKLYFSEVSFDFLTIDNLKAPEPELSIYIFGDVFELDILSGRNYGSLAAQDILEEIPDFEAGNIYSINTKINRIVNDRLSVFTRINLNQTTISIGDHTGNNIPYFPALSAEFGATWVSTNKIYAVAKTTYRGERYADDANASLLPSGADFSADFIWQSPLNHWQLSVNLNHLFNPNVDSLFLANVRYSF